MVIVSCIKLVRVYRTPLHRSGNTACMPPKQTCCSKNKLLQTNDLFLVLLSIYFYYFLDMKTFFVIFRPVDLVFHRNGLSIFAFIYLYTILHNLFMNCVWSGF